MEGYCNPTVISKVKKKPASASGHCLCFYSLFSLGFRFKIRTNPFNKIRNKSTNIIFPTTSATFNIRELLYKTVNHEQSVRFYTLCKIRLNKNNPEHNVLLFFASLIFALSIYLLFPFGGVIAGIARPQISLVDVLASNPRVPPMVAIFTSRSLATFCKSS